MLQNQRKVGNYDLKMHCEDYNNNNMINVT